MSYAWSPLAVLLTSTGLLLTASPAQAGGYREVDLRALEIQGQAEDLEYEFAHHYRFSPYYRHLMNDVSNLRATATHVHEVAHAEGSSAHLQADIQDLHAKFEHLEGLVLAVEQVPYGQARCDTRTVRRQLRQMHLSIDELAIAVEQVCRLPVPVYPNTFPANPPVAYPVRPAYPYGVPGRQRFDQDDHHGHYDDYRGPVNPRGPIPGGPQLNGPSFGPVPRGARTGSPSTTVRIGNGRFSIRIGR